MRAGGGIKKRAGLRWVESGSMGGREGERLVLSLFAPAYPAVDNLLGDGSALDNQCNTVVLLRVVDVDTAGIDTDELVLVHAVGIDQEVVGDFAAALGELLVVTDGACERVGGTDNVELGGIVEVAGFLGEGLQAFPGVVVEVVFVKLEVYDGGGQVEYLVDRQQFVEDVYWRSFFHAFTQFRHLVVQTDDFVVDGVDTYGIEVFAFAGEVLDGVALTVEMLDFAVEDL